jgi:hypothetical protein
MYNFNKIPFKIPMTFLTEIKNRILKFVWKHKRPQIGSAVLRKKGQHRSILIPDFKSYTEPS